jgi:hypothetical protein
VDAVEKKLQFSLLAEEPRRRSKFDKKKRGTPGS